MTDDRGQEEENNTGQLEVRLAVVTVACFINPNELKFFSGDGDISETFGLGPDESEVPNAWPGGPDRFNLHRLVEKRA